MAARLKEFSVGKAYSVGVRVFKILTNRTSIQFRLSGDFSMHPYKNKWGTFVGVQAYGLTTHRFYQINFKRGVEDQIFSIDIWAKEDDAQGTPPQYTCSLEGYGISKAFAQIEEFVSSPEEHFKWARVNEADSSSVAGWVSLQEAKGADDDAVVKFIADNPVWMDALSNIGSYQSGTPETKALLDATKLYRFLNGANIQNLGQLQRVAARVFNPKNRGKQIAQITNTPVAQVAAAGNSIAQTKTFPGPVGGVQQDLESFEDEWNALPDVIAQMEKYEGALGTIEWFKEELRAMYNTPGASPNLLVVSGRGGTGKSYNARVTLKRMGLSPGSDYVEITGRKAAVNVDGFQRVLAQYANLAFIILDDADAQMKSPDMANVLKGALQYDDEDRRSIDLAVSDKNAAKNQGVNGDDLLSKQVFKKIPFDAKIIWITNSDPVSLWKSNKWPDDDIKALVTRDYQKILFNFSNEEVLDIIKNGLMSMSTIGGDEITPEIRTAIFLAFRTVVERRSAGGRGNMWAGISFREFKSALNLYWRMVLCEKKSLSLYGAELQRRILKDLKPSDLQLAFTAPAAAL